MILNILTHPNNTLRKKSSVISADEILSAEFQKFLDDLGETMVEFDGAGLAAPQTGNLKRAVVIHAEDGEIKFYVNPKITYKSLRRSIVEEGCLSVPGVFGDVKRPKKIWIKYQDRKGIGHKERCDLYSSRVLQHEIDHLDGILFIDKMIKK
ncbi:MAG: peptide deformylase [Patescibacteria group bacterium]|nr:peptide deformylase [Patescibacteria group bacterium]